MLALLLLAAADESAASCPYHEGDGSSMFCFRNHEPDHGASCPELQMKRAYAFTDFMSNSYHSFLESAKTFPLAPLFDKTDSLVGDELYESMIKLHVDCMKNPAGAAIEDKIQLKTTASHAGVEATTMYYGSHVDDFDRGEFRAAMLAVCEQGVDALFLKATHMAWSMGQRIVRNWQETCKDPHEAIEELADWIINDVFTLRNQDADSAHLAEALRPGVIVEEIFQTGGNSTKPLEAKALVVWGQLFDVWMMGSDVRGCRIYSGTWKVYGDGNGWNLHGMMHEQDDSESTRFMRDYFPTIKTNAEKLATHLGADVARIDFFIGDGGVIKLNEVETVSGTWYEHERRDLGDIWRDGYVSSGRLSLDAVKWQERLQHNQEDRDHLLYHAGEGSVVV